MRACEQTEPCRPVKLPRRVLVSHLYDSHRHQTTAELVVSHQLLQPVVGVLQGLLLQERGEVVVELGVRWVVAQGTFT